MFRGLFSKHDEEEEYFEKVDPVVEQRRKEKFSTPLIYDDEFKQREETEKKAAVKKTEVKTAAEVAPVLETEEKPTKSGYQPLEVISPMRGASVSKNKIADKPVVLKPKTRKYEEQLVPVISPYFGMSKNTEREEEEDIILQPITTNSDLDTTQEVKEITTVEDNLRNIAKIVEEEQDQLKIIEERTGEFKLDFSNTKQEDEPSLIDEIDDNMSLDELMSLYEKKFTD